MDKVDWADLKPDPVLDRAAGSFGDHMPPAKKPRRPKKPKKEPVREATDSSVTVTVDGRKVTAKTTPSKTEATAQKKALATPEPPPPPDLLVAKPTVEQPFQTLDLEGPGPDDPVDWYVDVDFPPIIQKDIKPYSESLSTLSQILPASSPETPRLLAQMALTAFGVNDVDKVLDRLFPVLPDGIPPSQPEVVQPGAPPLQVMPGGIEAPKPPGQAPPGPVRESYAPARVHRIISTLRSAGVAVADLDRDGTGG